jgi:hypothetical protein
MLGVLADNANHAAAVNDFALIADLLDGRTDFHKTPEKQSLILRYCFINSRSTPLDSLFQLKAKS